MTSDSGWVTSVTTTHVTVLTATVMSMMYAVATGSPAGYSGLICQVAIVDVRNDATIALISDHAFTRHQYQRRMRTSPVPAPMESSSSHAPVIVPICDVTIALATKSSTVARRLAFT